jgi:hypothetical protein
MPVDPDLIARSGELERELVAFSRRPRFASAFREACNQRAGGMDDPRNVVDRFVLEHKLPDGRTVVDHFIKACAALTETEKQMVLGWRNVLPIADEWLFSGATNVLPESERATVLRAAAAGSAAACAVAGWQRCAARGNIWVPAGPLAGDSRSTQTMVLHSGDGPWRIAAFHNTSVRDMPGIPPLD